MNDGSRLMVSYIVPVYLLLIHHYIKLSSGNEAVEYLKDYGNLVSLYKRQNPESELASVYEITLLAIWLTLYEHTQDYEKKLKRALKLWDKYKNKKPNVPTEYWHDIYCLFPVAISVSIHDAAGIYPRNIAMFDDAVRVLNEAIQILDSNDEIENVIKNFYLGQIYQNLCVFFSYIPEHKPIARQYGCMALNSKKEYYKLRPEKSFRAEIAHNLFLLGTTYINFNNNPLLQSECEEALKYAKESYDIYRSLDTEGFIGLDAKKYMSYLQYGHILMYIPGRTEEGFAIVKECHDWNHKNPDNPYVKILDFQYQILKALYESHVSG